MPGGLRGAGTVRSWLRRRRHSTARVLKSENENEHGCYNMHASARTLGIILQIISWHAQCSGSVGDAMLSMLHLLGGLCGRRQHRKEFTLLLAAMAHGFYALYWSYDMAARL